MPGQEGITIRYDKDKKQFEILADTSTTFNIDSSMYFKGGLLISLIETKISMTVSCLLMVILLFKELTLDLQVLMINYLCIQKRGI